jgi:predicted O-linked N-acetylglucosamine transferase (SPINDLY family)
MMQSPLMDDAKFARAVEEAYREMWRQRETRTED